MSRYSAVVAVLLLAISAGCGGGGNSSAGKGSVSSGAPSIGGPVNPPVIVTVAGGGTATGINIQPPAPASNPAPNAQFLGTGAVGPGTLRASNTGSTIQRNIPTQVILFGPGLTSTMTITFGGPSGDITITSPIQAVTSIGSNPVPGVVFTVLVSQTATSGARSVILRAPNNDITTFTGGLEIVP